MHSDTVQYVRGAEIGRGSFATVFRAHHRRSAATVALKAVVRARLNRKLAENLESEIRILKDIAHPNIVRLLDILKTDAEIHLIMEFCALGDLSIFIKKKGIVAPLAESSSTALALSPSLAGPWGGLHEAVIRHFLGHIVSALEFLRSKNLIHRDLKPQNLLLSPATQDTPPTLLPSWLSSASQAPAAVVLPILKLADFGFARALPPQSMASTLCGSPLYMAPEILRGDRYDAKADLWSLGAILFEMITARPPFRAQNHIELLRKIERGDGWIKFPGEAPDEHAMQHQEYHHHHPQQPPQLISPQHPPQHQQQVHPQQHQQKTQYMPMPTPPSHRRSLSQIASSSGQPSAALHVGSLGSSPKYLQFTRTREIPSVPTDLKDLVRRLLKRNPVERMTFEELFMHPSIVSIRRNDSRLVSTDSIPGITAVHSSSLPTRSTFPSMLDAQSHQAQPHLPQPVNIGNATIVAATTNRPRSSSTGTNNSSNSDGARAVILQQQDGARHPSRPSVTSLRRSPSSASLHSPSSPSPLNPSSHLRSPVQPSIPISQRGEPTPIPRLLHHRVSMENLQSGQRFISPRDVTPVLVNAKPAATPWLGPLPNTFHGTPFTNTNVATTASPHATPSSDLPFQIANAIGSRMIEPPFPEYGTAPLTLDKLVPSDGMNREMSIGSTKPVMTKRGSITTPLPTTTTVFESKRPSVVSYTETSAMPTTTTIADALASAVITALPHASSHPQSTVGVVTELLRSDQSPGSPSLSSLGSSIGSFVFSEDGDDKKVAVVVVVGDDGDGVSGSGAPVSALTTTGVVDRKDRDVVISTTNNGVTEHGGVVQHPPRGSDLYRVQSQSPLMPVSSTTVGARCGFVSDTRRVNDVMVADVMKTNVDGGGSGSAHGSSTRSMPRPNTMQSSDEYVVVEKRVVEVNWLADQVESHVGMRASVGGDGVDMQRVGSSSSGGDVVKTRVMGSLRPPLDGQSYSPQGSPNVAFTGFGGVGMMDVSHAANPVTTSVVVTTSAAFTSPSLLTLSSAGAGAAVNMTTPAARYPTLPYMSRLETSVMDAHQTAFFESLHLCALHAHAVHDLADGYFDELVRVCRHGGYSQHRYRDVDDNGNGSGVSVPVDTTTPAVSTPHAVDTDTGITGPSHQWINNATVLMDETVSLYVYALGLYQRGIELAKQMWNQERGRVDVERRENVKEEQQLKQPQLARVNSSQALFGLGWSAAIAVAIAATSGSASASFSSGAQPGSGTATGPTPLSSSSQRRSTPASPLLVNLGIVVQWIRDRFNACLARADEAREQVASISKVVATAGNIDGGDAGVNATNVTRAPQPPEKIIYDTALRLSQVAAVNELHRHDKTTFEQGYHHAILLLEALLRGGGGDGDVDGCDDLCVDDRVVIERFVGGLYGRLKAIQSVSGL